MEKKQYTAPVVRKVRLEIKNAVLATCNSSPLYMSPKDPVTGEPCNLNPGCFNT